MTSSNNISRVTNIGLGGSTAKQLSSAMVSTHDETTVHRRWGVVTAVNSGSNTVNVTVGGVAIPDLPHYAYYRPKVGDRVILDAVTGDLVVVGPLAPSIRNGIPVTFSGYRSTTMQVFNNAINLIVPNIVEIDSHDFHNPAVNPSRITPTVPGWYTVRVFFNKENAWTAGSIGMMVLKNGFAQPGSDTFMTASVVRRIQHTKMIFLNGTGDWTEGMVYQDSGTTQTLPLVNGSSCGIEVMSHYLT